jgi:glycosyltransferase involved in cell wall biosynthesis
MPLVSVVIPTFNRVHLLRQALGSALRQSLKDIEIIVQDNASDTDPTLLVREIGDERVQLYRNGLNIGQTRNIVTACMRASGKYVAILGDDDIWQPDFLARLVPPLENDSQLVLSFCAHDYIDADGRVDVPRTRAINRRHRGGLAEGVYRSSVRIALVNRAVCALSAAVYRRAVIEWSAVPADLTFGTDNYINYLAARTGLGCYYQPRRLAQVRLLAQSASASVASADGRESCGRASMMYWNRFRHDRAVAAGRRYFAMKSTDNALRVALCVLRRCGVKPGLQELQALRRRGIIEPLSMLYHLRYGRR